LTTLTGLVITAIGVAAIQHAAIASYYKRYSKRSGQHSGDPGGRGTASNPDYLK